VDEVFGTHRLAAGVQNSYGNASMSDAADSKYSATNNSRVPAGSPLSAI